MESDHYQHHSIIRTHSIPSGILDDLASRFIINVPESQRKDIIRICFQCELAYWFYLDFYVENNGSHTYKGLSTCTMREFSEHMFRHIGFLREHVGQMEEILENWKVYKLAVPTYGAIILNHDLSHILLVRGFWSKTSWGFPKGKVNEDEPPHTCAIREVLEETGFNIAPLLHKDEYLEIVVHDRTTRLYIIHGVSMNTDFKPRTRNEIRDVKWFPLVDLPANKKEQISKHLGLTHSGLYKVMPFIKNIRQWISGYIQIRQQEKFRPTVLSRQTSTESNNKSKNAPSHSKNNHHYNNNSNNTSNIGTPQSLRKKKEKKTSVTSIKESKSVDDFCPKAWINFHVKRNELIHAMQSTPGWP
uniref:m7GpppN-mRNA hydrolase n=1 Tax=Lepeophtheirus salmonis TaxID=72036 RepID=C1BMG0_LEPSM|nr:mRNA-decapping enzyme 2 [Lepeophtheirus salmonis]